jgi:DeoR/GlpR family transcriptional regulator of sugar metabolism
MLSNAPERQRLILDYLRREETIRNAELRKRLGVTAMTLWRDLVSLEERGLLRRLHGRVTRVDRELVEPAFHHKADKARAAKEAIARAAAERFIRPGDTLAVDGGTTVAALADQPLPEPITIFTNSLHTADRFLRHPSRPTVHACGGLLRATSGTFIGREALSFFSRRKIRKAFLSATGIDLQAGITDLTLEDNEVKRAMALASAEVFLLADASKVGEVSLMQVLPWPRIDYFVTNATAEFTGPLAEAHPELSILRV